MWRYVLALYVVSYALQGVAIATGGLDSRYFEPLMIATMFLPAILAVGMLWRNGESFTSMAWGIGRLRYLIYAALLPALFAFGCILMITGLGWGTSTHWTLGTYEITLEKGGFLLGLGTQDWGFFALNYLLSALAFSALNGIAALGEEVGWRGYLQDRFVRRYGRGLGITLLGLVWGFWHLPIILVGYNYPETPVLGALLLFPATTVCASFFLAWLTTRAKSLWPAVLAHGSVNTFYGYIIAGMDHTGGSSLAADGLVLVVWGLVAVAAFVAYRSGDPYTRPQPVASAR